MIFAAVALFAAARIVDPSPGMESDDLIVCTHDATEFGAVTCRPNP